MAEVVDKEEDYEVIHSFSIINSLFQLDLEEVLQNIFIHLDPKR